MSLQLLKALFLFVTFALASNSTYHNPILPGFHPDPSCTFVPEWNETFFCASSSFLVFPGLRMCMLEGQCIFVNEFMQQYTPVKIFAPGSWSVML
jgi:hypothetical protein